MNQRAQNISEEDFRSLVDRLVEPVARRVMHGRPGNENRSTFQTVEEEVSSLFRLRGRGRGQPSLRRTFSSPPGRGRGGRTRSTPYPVGTATGKSIDVILLPSADQCAIVIGSARANLHEDGFVIDKFQIDRCWTEKEVYDRLTEAFSAKLSSGSCTTSFQILKPEGQRLVAPRLAPGDKLNGSKLCDVFYQKTIYLRPEKDIVLSISDDEGKASTPSVNPTPTSGLSSRTLLSSTSSSATPVPAHIASTSRSSTCDNMAVASTTQASSSFARVCPLCTFINDSPTDTCEMCDHPFTVISPTQTKNMRNKNPSDIIKRFTCTVNFIQKPPPPQRMHVSRSSLFGDNIAFFKRTAFNPKDGPIRVSFEEEEGVDAGGLCRENFRLFFAELREPAKNLFLTTNEGRLLPTNDQFHLFSGMYQVIGTALLNGIAVELPLADAIIAVLLNKPHEKVCEMLNKEDIIDTNLRNFIGEMLDVTDEDKFTSLICSEVHPTHWLDSCGWPVGKPMTVKEKHNIALCLMFQYIVGVRRHAIDAMQRGLMKGVPQNITGANAKEFSNLFASKAVSADELNVLVQSSLADLQVKHPDENAVKFITQLFKDIDDNEAKTFAIFVAGGGSVSPLSSLEINLALNTLHPDELSPIANACDCTLLLPLGHQSYEIFRSTIFSRMKDTGGRFLMF